MIIHDHDMTFYNYGGDHQECLEHVRRYHKDSMANEPNLKWNGKMRQLINEMIYFKKSLSPDDSRNPDEINSAKVKAFDGKYDEILKLAEAEYEYEPPNKYYPEGFNLYKRLVKYKSNHMLFLYNKDIDPTNNLSERLLRIFKRKQQQVILLNRFACHSKKCTAISGAFFVCFCSLLRLGCELCPLNGVAVNKESVILRGRDFWCILHVMASKCACYTRSLKHFP